MKRNLPILFVMSVSVLLGQRPAMVETPDTNRLLQAGAGCDSAGRSSERRNPGPFTLPSQAYPGTQHTYWVYVPAQYDAKVPASLMIYNDGQAFMNPEGDIRAQVVMDNLIYRREIPVMIGVFINPGRRPDQPEPTLKQLGRSRHEPADGIQHAG